MVNQIFLSLQVKRSVNIINKLAFTSLITICRTTKELVSYEIRKYQGNLKTSQNDCPAPRTRLPHPKMKISSALVKSRN